MRGYDFVNYPVRGGIIQYAFQAIAHLDAQGAIIMCYEQQRTIVDTFAPKFPHIDHAYAELLYGFRLGGGNDQHCYLRTLLRFKGCHARIQRLDLLRIQRAGEICDACSQLRHGNFGVRHARQQQRKQKDSRAQGFHFAGGAGFGELKSTVGA